MDNVLFDPSDYTRAPVFTLGSGITLALALVDACPSTAPELVQKAAKKLHTKLKASKAAWAERQKQDGQVSDNESREIDQEADQSWSMLRGRLDNYAGLPAERFPLAPRAAEIVTSLFGPNGLEFLKAPYTEQFATMDVLLKRIHDEQYEGDIDALAGPEFLKQLRHVHKRYGTMVKAMMQRQVDPGPSLAEQVRTLQRAIVDYATKVCATVDEDEPETVAAARAALRPIDQLREAAALRAASAKEAAPAPKPSASAKNGAAPAAEGAQGAAGPGAK